VFTSIKNNTDDQEKTGNNLRSNGKMVDTKTKMKTPIRDQNLQKRQNNWTHRLIQPWDMCLVIYKDILESITVYEPHL